MAQENKHMINESDVGSGEKTLGQLDVERDELSIGRGAPPDTTSTPEGRMLQRGDHLARIAVQPQPDGTFEAQVYLRLTREPEVAETYVPAGTFPTESEAWTAAEERANRAFTEHEF